MNKDFFEKGKNRIVVTQEELNKIKAEAVRDYGMYLLENNDESILSPIGWADKLEKGELK